MSFKILGKMDRCELTTIDREPTLGRKYPVEEEGCEQCTGLSFRPGLV